MAPQSIADFSANAALPFIVREALGIEADCQLPFPAFDPDHPDKEILGAYEKVRTYRAWAYSYDDAETDDRPTGLAVKADEISIDHEGRVEGTFANTAAGVAARLALLIPSIAGDRWVDRCVMENGLRSLYLARNDLDGHGQQLAQAAYELIQVEWYYALDAYHESLPAASFGADVVDEIDTVLAGVPEFAERLSKLRKMGLEFERAASNMKAIKRLMRTLVPDAEELGLKTQILAKENLLDEWSGPWLARDAAFLAGRLDGSAPPRRARRNATPPADAQTPEQEA